MSSSQRDVSPRAVALSIDKAIFGRTLVGWSLNASPIAAQFGRDQIVFAMPGGRRLRISFQERLKPLSDIVVNSNSNPYFIAIRPNAQVLGLKSFDSRFVSEDSDHDTRYITLFIDKDVDDVVDRIAALNEKYRFVMRQIEGDLLKRYDPFHERQTAEKRKRFSMSAPEPKRKRRRRSDSESPSSSNWSDVAARDYKPAQRRKSEPLQTTMPLPPRARKTRSLSPAGLRPSRSRSPDDHGRYEQWSEDAGRSRSRRSRSRSRQSRSREDRPRNYVSDSDVPAPARARPSRKNRASSGRRTQRPDKERRRSRKASMEPSETESEIANDVPARRRSRRTEVRSPAERLRTRRRRSRSRRRSTEVTEESDDDSRPAAKSSRTRPSERRSRSTRSESVPRNGRERARPRARDRTGDTTDSETHLRRAQLPASETESDRSSPLARDHRKLVSPKPQHRSGKRWSGAVPTEVPEQKRRVVFETIFIEDGSDQVESASPDRDALMSTSQSAGCTDPQETMVERKVADRELLVRKAPSSKSAPEIVEALSEDASAAEPVKAIACNVPGSHRCQSKSPRSRPEPDHAVGDQRNDESIQSPAESPPNRPNPSWQRMARKSSTPVTNETCTPSSEDDSESGGAKSIANPLRRSSDEPEIGPDPALTSTSSRILRPGMTVYWCAPGRILPQRRRQYGKIVRIFSHRKRIATKRCLRLDSGDVLTVNDVVKIDERSGSLARRLSEFTLISD